MWVDPECFRNLLQHLRNVVEYFWLLKKNCRIEVDDLKSILFEKTADELKQAQARYVHVLRVCIREMFADVAKCSCAEQSVAESMHKYICIGMTSQTELVLDSNSSEDELSAGYECVDIVPDADSDGRLVGLNGSRNLCIGPGILATQFSDPLRRQILDQL